MVMPFILAALVLLFKVAGLALAAGVVLLLLTVLLPVRARVSGFAAATGLFERWLEDGATLFVRMGDSSPVLEETEGDVVSLDLDFALEAGILAGAVGFSVGADGMSRVTVFGLPIRARTRRPKPSTQWKDADPQGARPVGRGSKGLKVRPSARSRELPKRESGKKDGISVQRITQYLSPEVRGKTLDALRSLFRALHPRGALDLQIGFQDPGTTAMVNAAYWGLGGPVRLGGITYRPVFTGEVFDVKGEGEVLLVPVQIGWIAARYLLSRQIRPLWRKPKAGRSGGTDAARQVGSVVAH